jgi:glycerol uptake facilitator protein
MGKSANSLGKRCVAEVIGTFILVFFGCGAVHAAVLTGAQSGLWQVAIVWGVAIMAAAYVVGGISGAHINPAITIALAAWGRFSWPQVLPYIIAQLAGAILAAAALFVVYSPFLDRREQANHVSRGKSGSEITAMCYGEYYPNPGLEATTPLYIKADREQLATIVPTAAAFLIEVLGTALLALVVFAVTDDKNLPQPISRLAPVFIGLTVSILISVIAPLTQACFNPARDFGPRLFAWYAGWQNIALPGPNGHGFFTVYILAPIIGAVTGGGLYRCVLQPSLEPDAPEKARY